MQMQLFDVPTDDSRDAYSTPQVIFLPMHKEFRFDIDACAVKATAKVPFYFGPDHEDPEYRDALSIDWSEFLFGVSMDQPPTIWMNPPYSFPLIEQFMRKAYEESLKGCTVVCLVCPSTCSNWWHDYAMKGEIRYIRGRINFIPPPGVKASTNSKDSVFVIFRGVK